MPASSTSTSIHLQVSAIKTRVFTAANTWKWMRGDVSRMTGGDLRAALGRIRAKTFVIPMSSDMFFPPADCQAEWRLIPDAEFRPVQTIDGHLALFGADQAAIAQIDQHLGDLLAATVP